MERVTYERDLAHDLLVNTNLSLWEMLRRSTARHGARPTTGTVPV